MEPLTRVVYDSILVITDRLTKYGYFIPYREESTAEELAYAFLRNIVGNHGMPKELISDRGVLFTSKFWRALMGQLGVNHKLSTAYHPQTDGQTERLNQTMEQYLRSYISYQQDDWVELLPLAQFAYNSSKSEATGLSPFFANYGYEPEAYHPPRDHDTMPRATIHVKKLASLHNHLREVLQERQITTTKQANKRRLKGPTFKEGDRIYLLRKNIKTKRPSDKLDYKKLGPFEVIKPIGDVNYKIALPPGVRLHDTYHVSLLEPAPPRTPLMTHLEIDNPEREYEVERIEQHKEDLEKNKLWYFIKWKGYAEKDNTWEPENNIPKELRQQYHRTSGRKHKKNPRSY